MPTKFGFQIGDKDDLTNSMLLEYIAVARPAAVLVFNAVSNLNAVYEQVGAGPAYAFQRPNMPSVADYLETADSLDEAVEHFLEDSAPYFQAARWAYHCSAYIETLTAETAMFDARALQLASERYDVRLCVGNFRTETPAPDAWPRYRPALEAAARYHGLIGLEELYPLVPYVAYGPQANIPAMDAPPHYLRNEIPYPQGYSGPGQFVGRYRYLRDYCAAENIPVQIFIRAMGAGRVFEPWLAQFGDNLHGWRTLSTLWGQFGFADPAKHYAEDIIWLDQHVYRMDDAVVGACLSGWNVREYPSRDISGARRLLGTLATYTNAARRDQGGGPSPRFSQPQPYTVTVPRLRIRPLPSTNNQYIGGYEQGDTFAATEYTFAEVYAWLRHPLGWSAYAPLDEAGQPRHNARYVEGPRIDPPRASSAVAQFVGTIAEVRQFLSAHQGQLFYISINPDSPPDGARQFKITAFPAQGGRSILNELHPEPGDPLMTPGARRQLR